MIRGEKIGEGTFGIVYAANSPRTHRTYAVKRNLVEDETSFIGAIREVDVLNKLRNHPHIVRLEHVAFGHPFINDCFSPLAGQQRLSQRDDSIHFVFNEANYDLHKFIYGAVKLDFYLTKKYMVDILLGLEYMHGQSIIHRDMKPSNILIFGTETDVFGNGNIAKICDFGLSKPFTYQGTQTPGTVTSWYRAPEIALGYPHYDYKSDIWATGCVFFEMMAKKAFIPNIPDNNDEILMCILNALPQPLSTQKLRSLVYSNKWRSVHIQRNQLPRFRKSFLDQFGLSSDAISQFDKQAGRIDLLCDLLNSMMKFDWSERFTATQCLDHPFFKDHTKLIAETRNRYKPNVRNEAPLIVRDCMERRWMSQMVHNIYNNRDRHRWYNHRTLFQAMDLFDRYITVMFHTKVIPSNAIESELTGLLHDKYGSELRFLTCLHLCIKYFSSIHYPIPFENIVPEMYRNDTATIIAEEFESSFIKNCLEYNIYRPSIYESADVFSDILDDHQVRQLIILYTNNTSYSGLKASELYSYYRDYLVDKPDNNLVLPIPPYYQLSSLTIQTTI